MTARRPPVALTIAGSDPTGGAGLQLDLQVFARHGVHGMAVPTALTVQTTTGVHRTLPVFPNIVGEQLGMLLADIRPDALKLGMLASDDVLLRVANTLDGWPELRRVVDPVLRASDGTFLLERRAWRSLMERVIAGATLVTPNLPEAETLTGERDPERAARILLEAGAHAVLVKGGHADGPADDLYATPDGVEWLHAERIEGPAPHGTGCALSAAITARLARGEPLLDAVRAAKAFVARAITSAQPFGKGARLLVLDDAS